MNNNLFDLMNNKEIRIIALDENNDNTVNILSFVAGDKIITFYPSYDYGEHYIKYDIKDCKKE